MYKESKLGSILLMVFRISCLISVVLGVVYGVAETIVFNKIGAYVDTKHVFAVIRNGEDSIHDIDFSRIDDAFGAICEGRLLGIIGFLLAVRLIVAIIYNIFECPIRTIIGGACIAGIVAMMLYYEKNPSLSHDVKQELIFVGGTLAMIYVLWLCVRGTTGGALTMISFIVFAINCFGIPAIVWLCEYSAYQIIGGVLAGAILLGAVFATLNGESSGSTSGASSSSSKDRERKKILDNIAKADRKINDNQKGLDNYYRGNSSGFHVDAKSTRAAIATGKADKDFWQKKLDALN